MSFLRAIEILFFVSGFTSLVFQLLWLRGLALVLGNTVHAMACVTIAFLAGLTTGSLGASVWLERKKISGRGGVVSYGVAEAVAGLTGWLVTLALFGETDRLIRMTAFLSSWVGQAPAHFLVALLFVLPATFAMGTTLPFLSLAVSDKTRLARLYGINTTGAAVGSLAASFVLIFYLGCRATAAVAAILCLIVAAVCFVLRPTDEPSSRPGPAPAARDRLSPGLALSVAIASGLAVFACEVAWHRYLSLLLGNRIYVTSVTLFLVLYALGLGARLARRYVATLGASSLAARAITVAVVSLALGLLAEGPALRQALAPPSAAKIGLTLFFVLAEVMIPATAMGVLFPLALVSRERLEGHGAWLGRLYAVNVLACLVGAFLSGYWLVEHLGNRGVVWSAGAGLLGLLVLLRRSLPANRRVAFALCLGWLAFLPFLARRPLLFPPDRTLLVEEDAHGLFTVARASEGTLRVLHNTTDLVFPFGSPVTQFVQETQAYLPLLFAPRLERALNIGAGYGITAGALARFEEVTTIDVVEILPSLLRHASLFSSGNYDYLSDPRVRAHLTDGRHFLATTSGSFDVISVNLTDPYLPGASSFFTPEFYRLVAARLSPGGVLSQHLFGPDLASLYRGVKEVFPHLRAIPSYANGLTVLASLEPLSPKQENSFRKKLSRDPSFFSRIGIDSLRRFEDLLKEGDRAIAALDSLPIAVRNTDDFPGLEFRRTRELAGWFHSNQ